MYSRQNWLELNKRWGAEEKSAGSFLWGIRTSKFICYRYFAFPSREADWEILENRTRSAMKEVVPCDVFKDPVMTDHPNQPFDAIVTTFCLESCV